MCAEKFLLNYGERLWINYRGKAQRHKLLRVVSQYRPDHPIDGVKMSLRVYCKDQIRGVFKQIAIFRFTETQRFFYVRTGQYFILQQPVSLRKLTGSLRDLCLQSVSGLLKLTVCGGLLQPASVDEERHEQQT